MNPLDAVPLGVQACFTLGTLLKLRALYRAGTINEQSLVGTAAGVLGHVVMALWSFYYANDLRLFAAALFGFAVTLPALTIIAVRYAKLAAVTA